jgi:hypothetical protein
MIGLKNDIESLRSLSQIFTPTNFDRIVRKKDYENTTARIQKHLSFPKSVNNLNIIQFVYKELLSNYKSEYLYKNALINKLLLGKYSLNTTTVINEFKIGSSIADFVLLNGEAKIFEIKTEYDSLDKLNKQLSDYVQFANKVYVVANSKFIDKLVEDYKDTTIGIIEFTDNNTLKELFPAKENNSYFNCTAIFKTLRKQEYLDIVKEYFGFIPDVPNTKVFKESLKLVESINVVDFQNLAYQKIKERKLKCPVEFLSNETPYELKHICYSLDMSSKEYSFLYQFLNQKV